MIGQQRTVLTRYPDLAIEGDYAVQTVIQYAVAGQHRLSVPETHMTDQIEGFIHAGRFQVIRLLNHDRFCFGRLFDLCPGDEIGLVLPLEFGKRKAGYPIDTSNKYNEITIQCQA